MCGRSSWYKCVRTWVVVAWVCVRTSVAMDCVCVFQFVCVLYVSIGMCGWHESRAKTYCVPVAEMQTK